MKSTLTRKTFAPTLMWRVGGLAVITSMAVPLVGCGSSAPPPPVDAAPGQMAPRAQTNQGMSTGTKLKVLAGAAAAYYAYNKWKQSQQGRAAQAQNVQYYISKSTGAIYYRDPKTKQAVFVTPPRREVRRVEIPADQAQQYSRFQGYDNRQTGDDLDSLDIFKVGN